MVGAKLEHFREALRGFREVLERLQDHAAFHPCVDQLRVEERGAFQDRRRGGQFVKHAEDASESDPSLVIFRAELEGAQVSDRRFVRPIESQIRFREEDPQPPVFVVAGDALQERLDCRLEPRLPEESNGGPEIRRRLLLRLRRGRLTARHGDVRLESVALRLCLRTDSIHRGSNHIRVVLDLRLGRSGGCGGVAIRRRRLCGWSGFLRDFS